MTDDIKRIQRGDLERLRNAGEKRRYDLPVLVDKTEVKLQGDALSPVWWQGRQWAVTEYGLEARDGSYYIDATRLDEHVLTDGWPKHMSGKAWVDEADFITAWLVALSMHGVTIKPEQIREAVGRSRGKEHYDD